MTLLDTPAVVVDLDRLERNLQRWQAHCDRVGLANRPHVKTHRSVEIAQRQLALGAAGVTCQKLGEAEVMADAGLADILLPYNVMGEAKLKRLVALSRPGRASVSPPPTSRETIAGYSNAFAAVGERDSGAGRMRHRAGPLRRADAGFEALAAGADHRPEPRAPSSRAS